GDDLGTLVPLQHRRDLRTADRLLCDDFLRAGSALRLHGPASSLASRLHLAPDAIPCAAYLALRRRTHAATLRKAQRSAVRATPHPTPQLRKPRRGGMRWGQNGRDR